jgi:hypothetical protein
MREVDLTIRLQFPKKLIWWTLQYDIEEGARKQTGWSVATKGHFVVEYEKHLWKAIWLAAKEQRRITRYLKAAGEDDSD